MYLQLDSEVNARPMVEDHACLDRLVEVHIHEEGEVHRDHRRIGVEAVDHKECDL